MAGLEYDKEAFLGGMIAKTIGKGLAKHGPTKGMKAKGMGMMNAHASRVSKANPMAARLKSTGGMGIKGTIGNMMARNSTGKMAARGRAMMQSKAKSNVQASRVNRRVTRATNEMAGKSRTVSGAPAGSMQDNMARGKIKWSPSQTSAVQGAKGKVTSTPVKTPTQQATIMNPSKMTPANNVPNPNVPNVPKGTPSTTPAPSGVGTTANTTVSSPAAVPPKVPKSKGFLKDVHKSYKQTGMYKDFGNKPLYAAGGVSAYAAGGGGGGGSPVVVNN